MEAGEETALTEDRLKLLVDLGIDMTTVEREERGGGASGDANMDDKEANRASKWDEKYHELKHYKEECGHTNVPRRSKRDPTKDALGEWVHFQRRQHRNLLTGKNSTMSICRKKALDYLEFQWTRTVGPSATTRNGTTYSTDIKEAVDAQIIKISATENPESWNERFAEFQAYKESHNDALVPKNYRENPFLGRWVHHQRELYNTWGEPVEDSELRMQQNGDEQNGLSKEKYDKLFAAGFVFQKPMPAIDGNDTIGEGVEGENIEVGGAYPKDEEEEEEQPVEEVGVDDIDIFIGFEESESSHGQVLTGTTMPTLEQQVAATEPAPVTEAPKEMELNESEVHAILEGKEEPPQHQHHMEHVHGVPMPAITNEEERQPMEMQNIEHNHVHQEQQEEQQTQMQVEEQTRPELPQITVLPRRITTKVTVQWEERVLELIQFRLRKHHCNVPAKWKPNPDLADWVWRQRVQYRRYRQNQPSSLTATRITKLADLGFEFVAIDHHGLPINEIDSKLYTSNDLDKLQGSAKKNPKRKGTPKSRFKEGKWLESLAKVVKYKEEQGNCNVPRKWKRDPTLGEWVHFQRRQFRLRQLNRRNHMTDERIRKLEAIGFEWTRGTNSQPSYIRLYEQNKELAAQTAALANENHVAEVAAMSSSEVPADVSQIAVMDGGEQVKAAEIAAVVEEQLNNPGEGECQEVENHHQQHQHQQMMEYEQQQMAHQEQHYAHHEEHQQHHHVVVDQQQQHEHEPEPEHRHHQVVDHQHNEGAVDHQQIHHHQMEEHQQHMGESIEEESLNEAHV